MSNIPNVVLWGPLRRQLRRILINLAAICRRNIIVWKSHFQKNRKCTKMTLNDLGSHKAKGSPICWITTSESQVLLRFALSMIAPSPDFLFLRRLLLWILSFRNKILKNQKLKFQQLPTQFYEDHCDENSGWVRKLLDAICRRSSVLTFSPP